MVRTEISHILGVHHVGQSSVSTNRQRRLALVEVNEDDLHKSDLQEDLDALGEWTNWRIRLVLGELESPQDHC